ncbi:glutamate--cysteine ligase regulatory subunit [Plakobranchus ocellatus]|uniref:GCS light chain n=1 Tax=Plakobranchus ocellatus TaxID=259542 RepID=A0AAV3ZA26_9GAST|nr:glutamate--cysteine ligase regulatory subunit [Plakobranchus ocellatus]
MADEIPLFPKATSMYIHTGNIINWNRLKRKLNQTSTEELCDCIGSSLNNYLSGADKTELQYVTQLYKINTENVDVFEDGEREEVKITVKIFVCTVQPTSVINEAVEKVLSELRTTYVESLLLAVAPPNDEEENEHNYVNMDIIKQYWETMEHLVTQDKVLSLGICDLNKEYLEELYKWAKVKPCVNQVNLESCCVMPKDLIEFAKATDIQLLTHNDKPVVLPKEQLQETIRSVSTERDSEAWLPHWVLRYSGILKCRGIIKMKGYIVHAERDPKKKLM